MEKDLVWVESVERGPAANKGFMVGVGERKLIVEEKN